MKDYQQSQSYTAAEKVIKLVVTLNQLPLIPEEARRHFVRGSALFKEAKSPDDFLLVEGEFKQAVYFAPCKIHALPVSNKNYFAGSLGEGGVFLSTNNGASWTVVSTGLPKVPVYAFAFSGKNFFAGTLSGVFLSTDNGTNWTTAGLPDIMVQALAISGTHLLAGTSDGLLLSTDKGASWTADSLVFDIVSAFAVSGKNIFAGTLSGVFLSTNTGASWNAANTGLTNTLVHALSVSGKNIFAGTSGGVFLSTNNGASWTAINAGLEDTLIVDAFAVSGKNLFAGTQNGGVFLSTNNGTSWNTAGLPNISVYALAFSGKNLFAGTEDGVFLSTNNGLSWTAVNTGLPDGTFIHALAVSGENLFAGIENSLFHFQQAVVDYQKSPTSENAEEVIKESVKMKHLPPIPEEARRHFVRGSALFKEAKSPNDFSLVLDEFKQAVYLAPWWPEAIYNWAVALKASGKYTDAINQLKLYKLCKLSDTETRDVQDEIYALEAKQEKAAQDKELAEKKKKMEADAKAERERLNSFEGEWWISYYSENGEKKHENCTFCKVHIKKEEGFYRAEGINDFCSKITFTLSSDRMLTGTFTPTAMELKSFYETTPDEVLKGVQGIVSYESTLTLSADGKTISGNCSNCQISYRRQTSLFSVKYFDFNVNKAPSSFVFILQRQIDKEYAEEETNEVKIGDQIWMKKNLDVDHYRNGDPIPQVQDANEWTNLKTGAWCYFDNNSNNGGKYGKLYNWYAVNDPRGLAPEGWHIPTDSEFHTLARTVNYSGNALKAIGQGTGSGTGTNTSGFSALLAGYRFYEGSFHDSGFNALFWSSTDSNPSAVSISHAYYMVLEYNNSTIFFHAPPKENGQSVRCLKD